MWMSFIICTASNESLWELENSSDSRGVEIDRWVTKGSQTEDYSFIA